MKIISLPLLIVILPAAASAATLYTSSTAFFSSTTWTGAPAGAAVTENFVASGGLYNFTGNEEFTSSSYTYGAPGSYTNTVTYARTDGAKILVDTSNEQGSFLSFDNPNSSKYLYVPANGGGERITISFSQPVSSFAFRIGDFGDPSGDPSENKYSSLYITSRNAQSAAYTLLVYEPYVDVSKNDGDNNFNTLNLPAGQSVIIGDDAWFFMGWTFDTPVDQILLDQQKSNNDSWGVDTVSFTTVPEPGAALLGGLGMLLMLRRRRI
ncbi:MAG: hypothetical protein ACO3G9_11200 [Chthoniobacterales bacterium]